MLSLGLDTVYQNCDEETGGGGQNLSLKGIPHRSSSFGATRNQRQKMGLPSLFTLKNLVCFPGRKAIATVLFLSFLSLDLNPLAGGC